MPPRVGRGLRPVDRRSSRPHRRPTRPAGWLRSFVVLAATLLAVVGTAPPAGATGAGTPAGTRTALTVAPYGDYVDRLSFDVASITPTLVTATGPSTLTITGTMRNTGAEELVDLAYRFQRGAALDSAAAVRDEITTPSEPIAQVPSQFESIPGSLPAGGSLPFVFTTALTGANGLNVTAPGVYPLMVNVNGGVVLSAGPLEARIGELHLLLTVLSVPGSGRPATPSGTPTPFNFVWPMVDEPHLGVDGVFLNDDLLAAISPGGRLDVLLGSLSGDAVRTLPAGALTVVIDPELLDELDRMTGPYRVVEPPGAAQPPVSAIAQAQQQAATQATGTATATSPSATPATTTPSTSGADDSAVDLPGTIAGTGQRAAASFLDRLRAVAATHPVVMLPYGDPDVVALVRSGMTGEVTATREHGQEVVRRVWGDLASVTAPAATSTAFPIDGAIDDATLSALMGEGARTGLLSAASVDVPTQSTGRAVGAPVIEPVGGDAGLPSVIARTDVLGGLDKLIDDGQQVGWARKVNSLTALLAQQRADGGTTPAVLAPVRRWAPDSVGLQGLVQLLGDLSGNGIISGRTLSDLTAGTGPAGSTDYPDLARERELSHDYLQRITTARSDVAALRTALAAVDQPTDPAIILDPLDRALDTAASTAFRTNPTVGDANVGTVESTVTSIRSGVQIANTGNSYTLASSTSPLLLTVQNNTPYDVPVTVELTGGEMVGLTVTEAPVQIIPAGRSQQIKIPTEVTRSGQFQVTATLIGPDGVAWGSPVQLTVQSSAYGALTVILMAVAGGVLVIMVFLRVRQRLRGRRARIAAERQAQLVDAARPARRTEPHPDQHPGPAADPHAIGTGPGPRPPEGRTENGQGFPS